MMIGLAAAVALLPVSLLGQFPAAGRYAAELRPPGQDQSFTLTLTVTSVGDSTALTLDQGPDQLIPLPEYAVRPHGFFMAIGTALRCDITKVEQGWDGLCTDTWNGPAFTVHVPEKPLPVEPPTSG
jgi:hypothetical protein